MSKTLYPSSGFKSIKIIKGNQKQQQQQQILLAGKQLLCKRCVNFFPGYYVLPNMEGLYSSKEGIYLIYRLERHYRKKYQITDLLNIQL